MQREKSMQELARATLRKFNSTRTKPKEITQELIDTWAETLSMYSEKYSEENIRKACTYAMMRTSHFPQPANVLEALKEITKKSRAEEKQTLVQYRRKVSTISQFYWERYLAADSKLQGKIDRVIKKCHEENVTPHLCVGRWHNLLQAKPLPRQSTLDESKQPDAEAHVSRDRNKPVLPSADDHVVKQPEHPRHLAVGKTQMFTDLSQLLRGHPGRPLDP